MGKHDKEQMLTANVDEAEWLRERNHTLAKENTQLRERIRELEMALGNMELCLEHGQNISEGINNELREEIEELKAMNAELKDALVRAALREV